VCATFGFTIITPFFLTEVSHSESSSPRFPSLLRAKLI
jgi:hypothetical protein